MEGRKDSHTKGKEKKGVPYSGGARLPKIGKNVEAKGFPTRRRIKLVRGGLRKKEKNKR